VGFGLLPLAALRRRPQSRSTPAAGRPAGFDPDGLRIVLSNRLQHAHRRRSVLPRVALALSSQALESVASNGARCSHRTPPRVPGVSNPSQGAKMEPEDQRTEYAAAHDALLHFTAFRWQGGSFLSTGVFVFWGLLIQQKLPASAIGVSTLLVSALMSVWILFAHQARQIYLAKLHRIHELERAMNMRQNLRFGFVAGGLDSATRYRTFGPRGYDLDLAVYVLTSIGGPLLGWARNGLSLWLFLPFPLVLGVIFWVRRNDRAMLAALRSNPSTA